MVSSLPELLQGHFSSPTLLPSLHLCLLTPCIPQSLPSYVSFTLFLLPLLTSLPTWPFTGSWLHGASLQDLEKMAHIVSICLTKGQDWQTSLAMRARRCGRCAHARSVCCLEWLGLGISWVFLGHRGVGPLMGMSWALHHNVGLLSLLEVAVIWHS